MNIKHTVLPNLRLIKNDIILESILKFEESGRYEIIDIKKIVNELEEACYNTAVEAILPSTEGLNNQLCEEIYHLKTARIIGFFEDEPSFKTLFKKIYEKNLSISDLPDVNIVELFPEKYAKQLARIDETGKDMPVKYSTLYHCRRCGQNKCYIQSAQTRSLDECNTIFVNCSCGNVFTV
jgi:DNA-directed RNA polymerase subunit M/transcription elongation factor TFIIS